MNKTLHNSEKVSLSLGVMSKIEKLFKEGRDKEADIVLADFVFMMMKRGMLVGIELDIWLESMKDDKRPPQSKSLQADDKTVNTRTYDKLARTLRGTDSW